MAVVTVGSVKTVYVGTPEIHSLDQDNVANVQVHVVPNSGGSWNATSVTQILRLGISTDDTYFFENLILSHLHQIMIRLWFLTKTLKTL